MHHLPVTNKYSDIAMTSAIQSNQRVCTAAIG